MKKLKFLFVLAISFLMIASCDKEDDPQDNDKLDAPSLIAPANNAVETYDSVTGTATVDFDWSTVASASNYELEVSTTNDFLNIVVTEIAVSSDAAITHSFFNDNTTYFWRVKASGVNVDDSDYSSIYSFTLASCIVCGEYNGDSDGTMEIPLTSTDTTFVGASTSIEVSETTTANVYELAIELSALLGAPSGTLVVYVDGTLSGNMITVTNEMFNYAGIANITVNGTMNIIGNSAVGNFTFTGDAIGTIAFDGNK